MVSRSSKGALASENSREYVASGVLRVGRRRAVNFKTPGFDGSSSDEVYKCTRTEGFGGLGTDCDEVASANMGAWVGLFTETV